MLRCTNALLTSARKAHTTATPVLSSISASKSRALTTSANHEIAILGGGITGLATAYFITQHLPTAKVTVYEAKDRIGGWLSSKRVPVKDGTILFEAGPRSLRPNGNGVLAAKMIQELGLGKDTIFTQRTSPAAKNRYLYYPDHLVRMPHPSFGFWDNFQNLWAEPVFEGALWAAASEFFKEEVRHDDSYDESVGDFFSRRLSKKMVDRILSGVIHGIYAGDVYQLSARSIFPGPWRQAQQEGGIFKGMLKAREGVEVTKLEADFLVKMQGFAWDPLLRATLRETSVFTFREGLNTFVDGLARRLWEHGSVEFKTSTPVQAIAPSKDGVGVLVTEKGSQETKKFNHVISALTPAHLNELTVGSPLAPETPSVTVMTVNLYYRQPDMHPPGFGYLIPRATPFEQNPERALGVVFDTAYSPSSQDADPSHWEIKDMDALKEQRENGRLLNVNDFAWYNFPEKPVIQDDVPVRGTKVTVMLGGHWWNDWPAYPDEKEGLAMARAVLERHLNIKQEPEAWAVNLQSNCIPQYTVGHQQRLKIAHTKILDRYKGRLRVAGAWISGVGVNDCLRSAWDVVQNISRGKEGTGLEHIGTNEFVRLKPAKPGQPGTRL